MARLTQVLTAVASLGVITLLSAGCDDPEPATPQVIFLSRFERGATNCRETGSIFEVGDFGNQAVEPKIPVRPVKDGDEEGQGNVSISCAVTPAGPDEFNVNASVQLTGAKGGLFRISGRFKATGTQTANAVFARTGLPSYSQNDGKCTVEYTTQFQGVAAGRVWGEVTCPNAEDPGAQVACEARAQFRFENCGQ